MDVNALNLTPVARDLLYSKIVDAIHSYIRANNLQPGDKLPSEREMAEVFQTSRNSVREALRVLENQGMLEVKTGRGTFLREQAGEGDAISIELIKSNFREVQELTYALETACLRLALVRAKPSQRQQLLLIAQTMVELLEEGRFSDERDHAFHIKLAEMSGNGTMAGLIRQLREEVFHQFWSTLGYDKTRSLETVINHLELARAIQQNDEARALGELSIIRSHTQTIMDAAVGTN